MNRGQHLRVSDRRIKGPPSNIAPARVGRECHRLTYVNRAGGGWPGARPSSRRDSFPYFLDGLFRIKVPSCVISNVTSLPGASLIFSRTSAGKVI